MHRLIWAGTHITLNGQLPLMDLTFPKTVCNRESHGIKDVQLNFMFIKDCGLSGLVNLFESLKSAFLYLAIKMF